MGVPTITGLGPKPQFEDVVAKINTLVNELTDHMLTMDSVNMLEVGGWIVDHNELVSTDGDVGMSTKDTEGDDIRFWAGDKIDGNPKFKVTKSGILTAIQAVLTSALIQSRTGYPKVEFNPEENFVAAYQDADTYTAMVPIYNSNPAIVFIDGGTLKTFLTRALGITTLGTFDGEPLNLQASGGLRINGTAGASGTFYVSSVPNGPANIPITFSNGIRTG